MQQKERIFSVSGSISLGDFDGINAVPDLSLPTHNSGKNLQMTVVDGGGVLTFISTIAGFQSPFSTRKTIKPQKRQPDA